MLRSAMRVILTSVIDNVQHKKSVLVLGHFFLFLLARLLFLGFHRRAPVVFFAQLIKLAILAGCLFRSATAPPH